MSTLKSKMLKAKTTIRNVFSAMTVEPLMLLDGLAFSNIHVYIENLQMDRVCRVSAGFSEDICENLKSNQEASVEVQQKYSVFALYNGIIAAALPLFFILFMGAWSDKYGRKVPLVAVQIGHALHAAGYLLASLFPSWPAEILLLVTLLDTLGGGTVSFLTAANSYLGDVTSEESRTSRVGLANSIWFLGGPAGTLLGTYIYTRGGYLPLFGTSLTLSIMAVVYVLVFLPESHGPFAKKEESETDTQKASLDMRDSVAAVYGIEKTPVTKIDLLQEDITVATMIKDFFNPRRIFDSFKSTLRKREGNTRALILLLIFTSLLRRLTRSPYVFAFTRHVLGWEANDYSLWVTYKNLMATTGSLVAVPLLSIYFGISDNVLAMIGAMSGIFEYIVYGCVTESHKYFIWVAPVAALLLNSCTIAQRAMMTKFVTRDEIGKVSAVLGALDGMMPMITSAVYTAVYHVSVSAFPAAHFFLGAGVSALMMALFSFIIKADKTREYDVEGAKPKDNSGPVKDKSLILRTDSNWLARADSVPLDIIPFHGMTKSCNTIVILSQIPKENSTSDSSDQQPSLSRRALISFKHALEKILGRANAFEESPKKQSNDKKPNISNLFININNIGKRTFISKLSDNTEKDEIREHKKLTNTDKRESFSNV
ncbi:hypothetical protein SK128_006948 [Halocaridina rubra]|uniref:Proton-coupled folate transporter n=1 Tax=Halocaridina rubra TaxID=373956 RepID=A0AAN9A7H2_HALRR